MQTYRGEIKLLILLAKSAFRIIIILRRVINYHLKFFNGLDLFSPKSSILVF